MTDYVEDLVKKRKEKARRRKLAHYTLLGNRSRLFGSAKRAAHRREYKVRVDKETKKKIVYYSKLDYVQMLKIELAKSFAVEHDIVDAIYYDGLENDVKPFTIISLKKVAPSEKVKNEANFEVETSNPIVFRTTWDHQKRFPSFVNYSTLPFDWHGERVRLADIDFDEIPTYVGESLTEKFKKLIIEVGNCNLRNRLLSLDKYVTLQTVVLEMGDAIKSQIKPIRLYFSGRGFRPILPAKEELFDELVGRNMLCGSSQIGYQSMRLFSTKINSPHLQTEIDYTSRYFRYTNPCFFLMKKNDVLAARLSEYYDSWLISHHKQRDYKTFTENQKRLEKEIIGLI